MTSIKYTVVNDWYVCDKNYIYYSERYQKPVLVPSGFVSDGATGAIDIKSKAWWVHDVLTEFNVFEDGSKCSIMQESMVLHDILKSEGFYIRAKTWFIATFIGRNILTRWRKVKGKICP